MKISPQPMALPTAFMRRRGRFSPLLHAARAALLCALAAAGLVSARAEAAAKAASPHFTLTSPTVRTAARMPPAYVGARGSCHGANQSPPLGWAHPPAGTKSYAVSMADLDAKVGVVWLWLMFNIPAEATGLAANAAADQAKLPNGAAQARNGFDALGYTGPCPKAGRLAHHYLITVWAVGEQALPFKNGTPAETVAVYLRRHALGHASLTPRYGLH